MQQAPKTPVLTPSTPGTTTVVELRRMLRERGLSTVGRKSVLLARLSAVSSPGLEPLALARGATDVSAQANASAQVSQNLNLRASDALPPSPSTQDLPWSPTLAGAPGSPAAVRTPRRLFSDGEESPSKRAKSSLDDETTPHTSASKPRISFGSVEVRRYRLSHGGSLSTPSKGAYPVGLSWEIAGEDSEVPLQEYENTRRSGSPKRLSERQRKILLEKADARSYFEKQASFETEKEELRQLRRARLNIGCGCSSPSSCGTSRCLCFKEGLACNDDSCRCTCETCLNPSRYNFSQEKVDAYRRRRILEAPYTEFGVDGVENN